MRSTVRGTIICLLFSGLCAGTGRAATVTWDNGGGDDAWTTGTNWDGDTVPGVGDDVVIPGGNTVNLSTTTSVNSLDCSGTFNLSGNTFTLAATSQIQASGTFNMSGGILTGAGNLTVNGSMTWTGGTMKGSGQTIIPSGKTLSISGSNNKTLESRTLTNQGTVTLSGTGAVRLYYGPTISNQSGGVFDVQGDVILDHYSGDYLTFTNAGTFLRSSGTGTATVEGIFNNTGTLNVQTGTVKLTNGGGTSSGQTTTVASGATLEFGGGTHTFSSGLTVANGTVKVSSGTMRMNGSSSLPAVVVTDGTLSANAATTAQTVTLSGGYQAGTSSLTVNGSMSWTGGYLAGTGSTVIASGATLSISGGVTKTLDARTLTNQGTVTLGSTVRLYYGGTISNQSGGVFDVQGDVALDHFSGDYLTFTNAGTFRRSSGTGTATVEGIFNNTGTLEVQTGTVKLTFGGGTSSGQTTTVASGATLEFGGGTHTFSSGLTVANGTVKVSSGTMRMNGSSSLPAVVVTDGTLSANAATTVQTVTLSGGYQAGTSSLTVNGSMSWTGGYLAGTGSTVIASGATLSISGGVTKTLDARTLTNQGTVTLGSTVRLYYGGTISNQSGGLFDVQGDVALDHFSGDHLTFTNVGTFRKSSGTGTATVEGIFNNTGTLDVQTGTVKLTLGGGTSSSQTTTVASGATLEFGGGTHTFSSGLTVANGTVKVSSGTMRMNGSSSLPAVVVTDGTLSANAATTAQTVTLSGGIQTGTSSLTVNGSMSWTGGYLKGTGSTVIASGATLSISGSNNKTLDARTLSNSGMVTLGGTGQVRLYYAATISNQSGGLFDAQSDAALAHYSGGYSTFTNVGTFRKSVGTGTTLLPMVFNNTGTLEVQTGKVKLTHGGGTSSGQTTTVASGTTLEFGGGTHTFSSGLTVANGTVKVSSGTVTLGGTGSLPAVELTDGTLTVNGATTAQSFTMSAGVQNGSSSLTVSGAMAWSGGTLRGSGSTAIASGGTLTTSGSAYKYLDGRTLSNSGTVTLGGTTEFRLMNAATISNQSGGLFDAPADLDLDHYSGSVSTFTNAGTFRKSSGTATTRVEAAFNNTGTLEVQSGTVRLAQGGTSSGQTTTVASGAILDFQGGTHTFSAGLTVGDGTLKLTSGTVVLGGTGSLPAVEVVDGTLTVNGATTVQMLTMSDSDGKQNGTSTLTVNGSMSWTGGILEGSGSTVIPSGVTLSISSSSYKYIDGRTLNNQGTVMQTGGYFYLRNAGAISNSGTYNIAGDYSISDNGGAASTFTNTGTFKKTSGTLSNSVYVQFINNGGTIQVEAGTLRFHKSSSFNGGTYAVTSGATLAFYESGQVYTVSGTLLGTLNGTFMLSNGTMTVASGGATFAMGGNGFRFERGTINGSGTLTNTGTFRITGTGFKYLSGATLANQGTVTHTGGNFRLDNGGTINNSGTFDAAGDYSVSDNGGAAARQFINTGTFKKTSGTLTGSVYVPFTNSGGTVQVDVGTLRFRKSSSFNGGTYTVASGATLIFSEGGQTHTISGTLSGTISGTIKVDAATLTVASGGATFAFGGNGFTFESGTINGSGTLTNTGPFRITGTNYKYLSGTTLVNQNTISQSGGNFYLQNGATLTNSGTYDLTTDGGVSLGTGAVPTFTNTGTFRKSSGSLTSSVYVPFTNSGGTVQVDSGTLRFRKSSSFNGGTYTVASGKVLIFSEGDQTHTVSGTLSGTISGTIKVDAATLTVASGGATFAFGGNGFTFESGTINGSGTLTNTGPFRITGTNYKYLSEVTLANQGTVTYTGERIYLQNGATINNSGTFDLATNAEISSSTGSGTVSNSGTFRKSSGTSTSEISVPFDNGSSGTIDVQTGTLYLSGTFANFSGSTLTGGNYQGAGKLKFTDASIATNTGNITLNGNSAPIVNQSGVNALSSLSANGSGGTITIENGANLTTSGAFSNAGALSVGASSSFTAGGNYTQTGGSTTLASGTLAAGTVDIQGGTLSGVGTINGSVVNGGQVTPGASPGVLDISGGYTQSSGGRLNVEIGGFTAGTEHDRLNVTGAAALDGTLDIGLINGFTPVTGNSFEIMSYGSRSGGFSSITGDGQNMLVNYGATSGSAFKPSDKPIVVLPGGAASFTEGSSGATLIDAGATVTDADSPNLNGGQLTVDLTANGTANDRLGIRNEGNSAGQTGVSGSTVSFGGVAIGTFAGGTNGSTPLVASLNSSATPASAQALLRNVTFDNVSEAPSALARTVRAVLSDGGGGTSTAVTQTVNVTPVNDSPVLATNAGLALTQGEEKVIGSAALQVTDVDNTTAQIAYTVTAVPTYGTLEKSGVALSANGTFTQQDVDNSLITYHHGNSHQIVDSFTATVADGAGGNIGATSFALNVDRAVSETSSAAGLSGGSTVAPGGEVKIFHVGLTANGGVSVNSVALTISDLSSATGIGAGAFSQLKLYRSTDAVLDGGDTAIGTQATVAVGSPTTIAAGTPDALPNGTEQFYLISAVMSSAVVDGQAFKVGFDANGASTSLGGRGSAVVAGDANKVTVDVVADRLVFTTQPAPLTSSSGSALDFTTDPVIEARDANGLRDTGFTDTVTLTETGAGTATYTNNSAAAVAGVATFSGLTVTYTSNAPGGETFALQADDTAGGAEGDITILPTSSSITSITINSDGILTAGSGVSEPVALPSTANSVGDALPIFDFALVDGGASDGKPLELSQVVVHTSGTGPFNKVVFRLSGPDASQVVGTQSGGLLTFSGLNISVANGQTETYAVDAYYSDTSGLTDGQTLGLSIDGDVDLTVGASGTQMSGGNAPVINGAGSAVAVVADRLVFATQPGGSVSGSALTTQPVVVAWDGQGNVDVDFVEVVTLSESSAGTLANGTATAVSGVATFAGVAYTASADGESFTLAADDQGGVGTDLPAVNANALTADVVADRLVFTTQPGGSVSGSALTTQPVVVAQDGQGLTDVGFAEVVTLSESSAGNLANGTATAVSGVATFAGVAYTASADGESFTLVADDQGGVGTDLSAASASALTADVVADRLVFVTQPAGAVHGVAMTTQPVVVAQDDQGLTDVGFTGSVSLAVSAGSTLSNGTATAQSGTATFSGVAVSGAGSGRTLTAQGSFPGQVSSDPFAVQTAPVAILINWNDRYKRYDGKPGVVSVTTQPAGVPVAVTYGGSGDAPIGPGDYEVVATVIDPNYTGQVVRLRLEIDPPPPPTAALQASVMQGNPPLQVTFTERSTGFIGSWRLETSDDGQRVLTDRSQPLTATYSQPGSYQAQLVVQGPGGQARAAVAIVVNGPPQVAEIGAVAGVEDEVLMLDLTGADAQPGSWSVEDVNDQLIAGVEQVGDVLRFTPMRDAAGSDAVRIVRTNSHQLSTSQMVALTWAPVDDPPGIYPALDGLFTTFEDIAIQVGGAVHARDVDTEIGTLAWSASGYDETLVGGVQGSGEGMVFSPVPDAYGETQAVIHLTDPATGQAATQTVLLRWTPVNDPPQAPVAIYPVNGALDIVLAPVISWATTDVEGSALSYDLVLRMETGEMVAEEAGLMVSEYAIGLLSPGTAYRCQVTVRDGEGASSQSSFSFTTEADRTPPAVSDVRAAATHELATVSWRTDEEATGRVAYRSLPEDGTSVVSGAAEQTVSGVAHQVTLSGLLPAMWYEYEVVAVDGAVPGNASALAGGRLRTLAAPDIDPPQIQVGPYVEGITQESAVVRWTTDELSTSVVRYWQATGAGNGPATEVVLGEMVDDHLVKLEGLVAGTTYGYEVQSLDGAVPVANASVVKSGDSFSTEKEKDKIPPVFEAGPAAQSIMDRSAILLLRASEVVRVQVRFDADADLSDGRTASSAQVGTEHQIALTGLMPETEYYYQVTLTDESGNPFSSAVRSFATPAAPDTRPPGYLVSPGAESVTDVSAVLVLTADEPVRVQVLVAPAAEPANTVLQESRELKEGHALLLTNLVPETAYAYEVLIEDGVPNRADPVAGGFRTEAAPDVDPPIVEGPFIEGVGSDGAAVVFRTDEPSTGEVTLHMAAGGMATGGLQRKIVLTNLAREHRVQLTQLTADRDYAVQVIARDGAQPAPNSSQQQMMIFHTRREPDTEPPQKVVGPELVEVAPTRALLQISFNEPVEVEVRYSVNADLSGGMMRTLTTRQKSHAVELVGLERERRYYVRLLARDAAGLEGEPLQTELVTPLKEDGTPPRFVAMPVAIEVLALSARVGFAVDEPVTAEMVVSSHADLSDPLPVVRSTQRSKEQELRVSGLQPRQTYYFRVVATNSGGQMSVGGGDFKTPTDQSVLFPRIAVGPSQQTVEDRSVTLYLRANKPSVLTVNYRSADDPGSEERTETQTVLQKEHTLVLTNLQSATRYIYTAYLEDEQGKMSSLRRGRFTTRKVADEVPPRMQGRPTVRNLRHDQATIFWRTNEAADSQVRAWTEDREWNVGDGASLRGHRLTLTNLEGGKEYSYQVSSTDAAGNGPTLSEVYHFTPPSSPDREAPQFIGKPIVKGRDFDGVVLSWSTDEPVSARVSYGKTTEYEMGQEGKWDSRSDWEWTLTGLAAETTYFVRISVDDTRRNGPTVHEMTVATLAEPDRQSPEIRQGPIAVATTQTEAVIEWTTDEPADGKVSYAWDGGSDEIVDPEHVLEHRMVLSGLIAGTAYSYTVSSQDIAQNPATVSGIGMFSTKKMPDTTPPTITSGPLALDVSENRATLFWTTDEPATSVVDYGTTTGYGGHLEFGELVQEHQVALEHLDPGTVYHFKVGSTDLAGHAVSTDPWGGKLYSVDHILVTQGQRDTAPPQFEQPPTVRWTNRNAVVAWTTDEVSTSRVDWVGGGKDGFVEDNRMVREHSLTLNRLRPRTGYRFMVRSEDREGNRQVWGSTAGAKWVTLTFNAAGKLLQPPGGAGLFVTDNFPDSQLPLITSGPQVREKTVNSLTLAWETDELADSFVRFGLDEGLDEVVGAAQDVQDHQLTVTGLAPGTTYYYRVESTDPSGNGATESAVGVVVTPSEVDLSPPRFVTQPQTVAVTDEELVIGWKTDEAASARVEYQVGEDVQMRQIVERQTRHQVTLTNLTAETEYRVRVFVVDASQNEGGADVELRVQTESAPDLEAPRIVSGPELVHIDDRSATITWETDEVSDSFVDYDATPYLGQVVGSSTYVSEHQVTLTNLDPGTKYHYRVGSRDRSSNGPVESQVYKFTTAVEADVEAPSVPEGLTVRAGWDANWLTWELGEEADLAGYVVYREDESGVFVAIATNVQEVSYLDEGLEENREYRYRVSALDRQLPPNESEMSEVVFGTPSVDRVPGKPEIRGLEAGAEPERPVVVLENAETGDPSAVLTYTIQLSTSPDFSDVVDRGGNVEEGPGVTRWRVTRELAVDAAYWCRGRVSDGMLEGPWSEAVLLMPAEVDDRAALSSDFDGDGSVDFGDFFLLANGFGGTSAALDMDGRGQVDFGDFFLFADDFGKTTAHKAHRLREVAVEEAASLELAAEAIDSRNILVQLRMEGMGKMAGYGARLSYDAGTLSFVGLADSSGRLLGGPELSLLLTKEQGGSLRLTEHLRGKLEGEELPEGQVVQLLFALQGRPESSQIRVEEGYISRNHRQVVAVGQLGVARVVPQAYALYPAYPNPFNPSTTIPLALPVAGRAELEVYNVLGQMVQKWDLSGLEPGFHAISWDGMDREGRGVGSGVYLVLLRAEPADPSRQVALRKESFRQTRKILLLR